MSLEKEVVSKQIARSTLQRPRVNVNTVALISVILALLYFSVVFFSFPLPYFLMMLFAWPSYFMYLLYGFAFSFHDVEGIALGAGILMEFIGPLFVFICWFTILYLVGKVLIKVSPGFSTKIKLLRAVPYSKKTLVVCILVTIIFTAITPIYYFVQSRKELAQYSKEKQQTINRYANSYSGNYFEIPEINVKFKLPYGLNDLIYTVIQNDSTRMVVGFSSNSLASFPECSAKDTPLGVMVRYPKSGSSDIGKMTGFLILDGPREYNLSCSNGCGYHPYSPYKMGNYYYFYDDPFEVTDNPTNPDYKYRTHPMGYLGYLGACSSNTTATDLQMKQLDLLKPALSTVSLIKN